MHIELSSSVPPPKLKTRRLTPEIKEIAPGQSVLVDKPTADALTTFLRYRGYASTRLKEGEQYRVWRLS
jgi:hypothetical protein